MFLFFIKPCYDQVVQWAGSIRTKHLRRAGWFFASSDYHTGSNPLYLNNHENIRLSVMLLDRSSLALRKLEELLDESSINASHEAVRYCWYCFGPILAAEIIKRRVSNVKPSKWCWHLYELFLQINA